MISIHYNGQPMTTDNGICISDFIRKTDLSASNIAVAVNNTVVPRSQWDTATLKDGDSVLVIKASYGG